MSLGAMIMAKGISRRCENKNTRMCGGKRLIEWAIDNANGAKCVDQVFISTDSDIIKDIAIKRGARVIDRPWQLATEKAGGAASQLSAYKAVHDMGFQFDHLLSVWCTSPLVQSWQIQDAYDKFRKARWAKQLHTVTRAKASIICNAQIIDPVLNRLYSPFGVSQPPGYFSIMDWVFQNGAFQILNPNLLDYDSLPDIPHDMAPEQVEFMYSPFFTTWGAESFPKMQETTYGYVLDDISAFDINTEDELDLADYYFRKRKEKNTNAGNI